MTPSLRTLPVIDATWDPLRKSFLVVLPGNVALLAPTEWDMSEIVRRHAPGSAVRWIYPTAAAPRPAPSVAAPVRQRQQVAPATTGRTGAPHVSEAVGLGTQAASRSRDLALGIGGAPLLDTAGDVGAPVRGTP